MSASTLTPCELKPGQRAYRPYGAAEKLFYSRAKEVVVSGPAGTGKSRACLEKLHLCALKYAGMRGLILRKTRESLTEAALVTWESRVLPEGSPVLAGPQRRMRQAYHYPNGSEIVVGGLDKASKVLSTDYDMVFVQESVELTEDEWETLTTRLRTGTLPYQQLMGDTNPDAPTHWLRRRAGAGQTLMLESRHEDNPSVTDEYLATLDALTGIRHQRFRLGLWVAAEGQVHTDYDPAFHLIDRFPIPDSWPVFWVCDFGFTNPFVWQAWAMDSDGRLFRYREIYMTGRLVEDHARQIREVTKDDRRPRALICDTDAEDRATLERYLGMATTPAFKSVSPGLQAVAARLRAAGDDMARLYFLRGSLVERDARLDAAKKPCSTEEEFGGYVWDTSANRRQGEEPLKKDDHGMDATRYLVAHVDDIGRERVDPLLGMIVSRAVKGW